MGKKLEKMQRAVEQQKGKLYIIMACVALLVCGCKPHVKDDALEHLELKLI